MLKYAQNVLIHKQLSDIFYTFAKSMLQNGDEEADNWVVIIARKCSPTYLKKRLKLTLCG